MNQKINRKELMVFGAIVIVAFFIALLLVILTGGRRAPSLEEVRQKIKQQDGGSGYGGFLTRSGGQGGASRQGLRLDSITGSQSKSSDAVAGPEQQSGSAETGSSTKQRWSTTTGSQTRNTTSTGGAGGQPPQTPEERATQKAITQPIPTITFANYKLSTQYPTLPQTVKIYHLKTDFTQQDALNIAAAMGMNVSSVEKKGNYVMVSDDSDSPSNGFVNLDKRSGAFTFVSGGFHTVPTNSRDAKTIAKTVLQNLGLMDETVFITTTYKNRETPGLIYVEAHKIVNFPILNVVSTLNLSDDVPLASVRAGVANDSSLPDPAIYDSSDGQNSKQRLNDHNTATVAVEEKTGRIVSITSSIRRTTAVETIQTANELITPQEAFARAKAGQIAFSLATPTGEGFIDITKLTPQQFTLGEYGEIKDFILAYPDSTPDHSQQKYEPHYILRGKGEVSGYRVHFVQLVSAMKRTTAVNVLGDSTSPPVITRPVDTRLTNASKAATLQYATIEFEAAQEPPPPEPPPPGSCPTFSNCYQPKGQCGKVCYFPATFKQTCDENRKCRGRNWYYVACPDETISLDAATLQQWHKLRLEALKAAAPANAQTTPKTALVSRTDRCYHIATGSPAIYLYAPQQPVSASISINPLGGATYVDPAFSNVDKNTWKLTADSFGTLTLSDGTRHNRLYYEINTLKVIPHLLAAPDDLQGFVIEKAQLDSFVTTTLARALGLTEPEKKQLRAEVLREAQKLTSRFVRLSFIKEELLNRYLPLHISPSPAHLYRLVLLLRPETKNISLPAPLLPLITRSGFTVLELGVLIDN